MKVLLSELAEKIFGGKGKISSNPYLSLTWVVLLVSLVVAASAAILITVSLYLNIIHKTGNIGISVTFILGLLFTVVKTYLALQHLSTIGKKIGIVVYALVIYIFSFILFYKFIIYVIPVAICLFIAGLILKFIFNSNSKKDNIGNCDGTFQPDIHSKGNINEDNI